MWLNKIKQTLATIGLKTVDIRVRASVAPVAVEDESAVNKRQRVNQEFDKQWNNIQTRAMMPHDPKCEDSWTCTKAPCFKWEPDKTVGKPFGYVGQQDSLAKIARMKDNNIIASKLIKR